MRKLLQTTGLVVTLSASLFAADNTRYTDKEYRETLGWLMGSQAGLDEQFGFTQAEKEDVISGFKDGVNKTEPKVNLETSGDDFNAYLQGKVMVQQEKQTAELKKEGEVNRKDAEGFLKAQKTQPNVKATMVNSDFEPSQSIELLYEIQNPGNKNKKPTEGRMVKVEYTGKLLNGEVFDQSQEGNPVEFVIENTITGFREGLKLIGEGGSIKLYVHPDLAYGDKVVGNQIRPGSLLVFDVKLLTVGDKVEAQDPLTQFTSTQS